MSRLRVGVVGVGYLGWFHAQKYAGLEGVDLVGVADLDFARAEKAAQDFQTRPFRSHAELGGLVDAVSVAVTTSEHAKVASELLSQGIHCLVEKPLSATLAEADQIIASAEKGGAVLQVGHLERFNPAVAAIRDHLTSPVFMEARRLTTFRNRGLDVDVILDLMIHDIDIILGLVNSKVKHIEAVGISTVSDHEDLANVRLTFQNNAIADITASRVTKEETRTIRIFQEQSYILLDYLHQEAFLFHGSDKKLEKNKIRIRKKEPLKVELKSFIGCVRNKKKPVVSGQEGKEALQVALDILEKINSNNASMLPQGTCS